MRNYLKAALTGLAACVLGLCLAACTTLDNTVSTVETVIQTKVLNPFDDYTVVALGGTLAAANGLIIAYGAEPACPDDLALALGNTAPGTTQLCHNKKLLKTLYTVSVTAVSAYTDLVELQKTHPKGSVLVGGTLHDKFAAAQSALAAVTSLTNTYVAVKGAN